jgi:hypothetical protein
VREIRSSEERPPTSGARSSYLAHARMEPPVARRALEHEQREQRKVETLYSPKLHVTKFLAVPIMVAPLVLGLGGVALAANPTNPPPPLPPDQIVLSAVCVSATQVTAAAQQALSLYVAGSPPAGLIINGNWMPAAQVASSVEYGGGCAGPIVPTGSPLLPTDQIAIAGCPSIAQVTTAAQDAVALYVPGAAPAGVIVNGNWVPAGIAASPGGSLASGGCAVS